MLKKFTYQSIFICTTLVFSTITLAQVEVVNQQLIDRYSLDFSPLQVDLSLEIGADGALYLRDNSNNTLELISKTIAGQPADLKGPDYFDASSDFEKIAFVSSNPDIVNGDSGLTEDVFVYDRSSGLTIRAEGLAAHNGRIDELRLSPTGNFAAFISTDSNFGPIVGAYTNTNTRIYNYDFNQNQLSTVRYEGSGKGSSYLKLPDDGKDGGDSFSHDESKLFFYVQFDDGYDDEFQLYYNEIQPNTTTQIQGGMGSGTQTIIHALSNSHFVYYSAFYDDFSHSVKHMRANIYNIDTGVIDTPGYDAQGRWQHFAGISADSRFALFYTTRYNQGYVGDYIDKDHLGSEAGIIRVYDLLTAQSLPAFSVNRQAKHLVDYDSVGIETCSFVYVLSQEYLDEIAHEFPCTQFNPINDIDDYISQSWDTFNLDINKIRFHNDNRYITFDANAWHLDESIVHDDFIIPYVQDNFVVANPFLDSINLLGEPIIDGLTQSGVFMWRTTDGRTLMRVVAGDPAQNGQMTDFEGSITSGSVLQSLLPINLEDSDNLIQTKSNRIDFDFIAQRPWNDQFSFIADINKSLCVDLTTYVGGLYLGPDKIAVTPPYDIHTMKTCENSVIEVDGEPSIDQSVDAGWFIWRESGTWHNRFVAGDNRHLFIGSLSSSSNMTDLIPVSIESNDVLGTLPLKELTFELKVKSPYRDGFSLKTDSEANTCAHLKGPADLKIYLGPDRVEMPRSFDLNTLGACHNDPGIATRGKPSIDRTTDKGIFLWERASNGWSVEVVSGDSTKVTVIDIEVSSQKLLSGVEQVNIEPTDVFTILPQLLDLRLKVKAPWHDGFKFTQQPQSDTCVSTSNVALPIYLGPNREEMGNSVNLATQSNCL